MTKPNSRQQHTDYSERTITFFLTVFKFWGMQKLTIKVKTGNSSCNRHFKKLKISFQIAGSVECVYNFECSESMPHNKVLAALEKYFALC